VCWRAIKIYKNCALRKEAGPPPVRLRRRQHNQRRLCTNNKPFTTVDVTAAGRRSSSVYNSFGLTQRLTRGRINVCIFCIWGGSQRDNRISISDANFVIVCHGNYGLSWLVIDMWLRDGRRTDGRTTNYRIYSPSLTQPAIKSEKASNVDEHAECVKDRKKKWNKFAHSTVHRRQPTGEMSRWVTKETKGFHSCTRGIRQHLNFDK